MKGIGQENKRVKPLSREERRRSWTKIGKKIKKLESDYTGQRIGEKYYHMMRKKYEEMLKGKHKEEN